MSEFDFEGVKHHGWMEAVLAAMKACPKGANPSESVEYHRGRREGIQEYFEALYALGSKPSSETRGLRGGRDD